MHDSASFFFLLLLVRTRQWLAITEAATAEVSRLRDVHSSTRRKVRFWPNLAWQTNAVWARKWYIGPL